MKVVVRWLGIMLLVAGCYWLAEDGSNFIRSDKNAGAGVSVYEEVQKADSAPILMASTGEHETEFTNQWRYIFSNPMYILLIIIAVFLNVVLLRKLIKEEL